MSCVNANFCAHTTKVDAALQPNLMLGPADIDLHKQGTPNSPENQDQWLSRSGLGDRRWVSFLVLGESSAKCFDGLAR